MRIIYNCSSKQLMTLKCLTKRFPIEEGVYCHFTQQLFGNMKRKKACPTEIRQASLFIIDCAKL